MKSRSTVGDAMVFAAMAMLSAKMWILVHL